MEALTGASVAALTIYDMCKGFSHNIVIKETRLLRKQGGKKRFQTTPINGTSKNTLLSTKPQGGKFHRNEMAFLGAPCGDIQRLTSALASELTLDLGYVDADHGDGGQAPDFGTTYTDKISHHQFEFDHQDYTYRFRQLFNDKDGILVNGNHFLAARQIVIINDKKEESLNRKLDRLTQVEAFILDEGMSQPFEFLKSLPEYEKIPILHIHDIAKIAQVVKASFLLVSAD